MSTATLNPPMTRKPKPGDNPTPAGRVVLLDRIVLTASWARQNHRRHAPRRAPQLALPRPRPRDRSPPPAHRPPDLRRARRTHFRHLESLVLASLLGQRRAVLALGGGAPEELGNRLLLEQTPHTVVVYLSAPFDTLIARCSVQATDPAAAARPKPRRPQPRRAPLPPPPSPLRAHRRPHHPHRRTHPRPDCRRGPHRHPPAQHPPLTTTQA